MLWCYDILSYTPYTGFFFFFLADIVFSEWPLYFIFGPADVSEKVQLNLPPLWIRETRSSANGDWRQGGAVHVVQSASEEGSIACEKAMSQWNNQSREIQSG